MTDAARFAAIVACSSDAIISKSLDGIVQTWNPAAEALFGWTADEIIGQSITRIIPEDLLDEEQRIIDSIRRGEIVPKFQTTRLAKDGTAIPIAVTVSPVRDSSGRVVGASKIANDLREQTRLLAGIREKTEQFTALANNIPQLAWIANEEGWIYWFNQRWYDYTGTTLEDMEGWGWKSVHHPDHIDRVVERIQQAWDSGEPWEDTFPLKRHDGVYRWFLSRANPLKDEDGRVILWCGSNTDITEELEAKNHIALLMREVNHRSRNMLATIQAMLNRSRHRSGEELAQSLLRRIAALKSNQEILDGGDWTGARIIDIVSAQIQHVGGGQRARIEISGPENLMIGTRHAEALGLAIHELATNADKYGALSNDTGRVQVGWRRSDSDDREPTMEFFWKETGGPKAGPPTQTGFGTLLIRQNIEAVFRADVTLDYREEGLFWSVECPADTCLIDRIDRVETQQYLR
jgi:PAS domain S-box-containing protein